MTKAMHLRKWFIGIASVLLLAGLVTAVTGFYLPWHYAACTLPAGDLVIAQQEDGSLLLSWPEADTADRYLLEVLETAENGDSGLLRSQHTDIPQAVLPDLPSAADLTLRITAQTDYETLTGSYSRVSSNTLEVTTQLNFPQVEATTWSVDPDTKQFSVDFDASYSDQVMFSFFLDDQELHTREITGNSLTLSFADVGDFPVPQHGEICTLRFRASRQEEGLRFLGAVSTEFSLGREDFLGRDLSLSCTDLGSNVCRLTWTETKGAIYEVQQWDASENAWTTLRQIPADGERSYISSHLAPCTAYTFRVVAAGGQTMADSDFAAISDEIPFTTGCSPVYATVWPIDDLTAYRDSSRKEVIGKAVAGEAYCVLEETDGFFAVSVSGTLGYIDSRYCLINLPDYMGNLCSYNIANSYSSLYMVHEFKIPRVTDVVTAGYEKIRLSDGSFLVPLLYPTAQKLAAAAENALAQGYRLKIYDAYRPYTATRQIYDRTAAVLDDPIPSKTFTGVSLKSLNLPEAGEDEELTYRDVMTDGIHDLSAFLAKSGSTHNQGVALDLTLEVAATGQELKMQTSIHDLSRYSILRYNNAAANTLASIMTQAGFGTLSSEWWHFQDNEARKDLSLPYFRSGLSCTGWFRDDWDWKYRKADGSCYRDATVTIHGSSYSFNENGYLTYG